MSLLNLQSHCPPCPLPSQRPCPSTPLPPSARAAARPVQLASTPALLRGFPAVTLASRLCHTGTPVVTTGVPHGTPAVYPPAQAAHKGPHRGLPRRCVRAALPGRRPTDDDTSADSWRPAVRASAASAPSSAPEVPRPENDKAATVVGEGGGVFHVYNGTWEFQGTPPREAGAGAQPRDRTRGSHAPPRHRTPDPGQRRAAVLKSVPITVHGCVSEEDASWLREQVLQLPGVTAVFVQGLKEGGLRGGAVQLQVEVEASVKLTDLVDAVHGVEERLLALPFKTHSWLWRGHRLSYAVAGCGRPIILVHGFGGSAGHFRNLIAHLAEDHRVYAVDLLGFGNSDKPAHVDYGPHLWADIINDFAADFTEEPPVIIGNSIGSLTALAAAAQMSAQSRAARGLVLLNVAGGMNRKGLMGDDLLLRALSPVFLAIEFLLQKPKVASFLFERFRSKANVRKILAEQVYRNRRQVDDRLLDILYEPSQDPGALQVFVKVFTGDPGPRPEPLVQQLDRVPILVLWGDADPWTPIDGKVAKLFRQLESERGNVRLVALPDVGHCPHDDRPELAASHILPWIKSLDAAEL